MTTANQCLTTDGFDAISALLARKTAIRIGRAKEILLRARAASRLQALGLTSYHDYLEQLSAPGGRDEIEKLIAALTTSVTSFFRERHQFERIQHRILPELVRDARSGRGLRLWSAGCATGEEAWSLALCVAAACTDWQRLNVRLLASDIDRPALNRAAAGRYDLGALRQIPQEYRSLVPSDGDFRALAPMVHFRHLNLHSSWPMRRKFDLIMCRNTAIYFDRPAQHKLWLRLAQQLQPGGHLFIGHSETIQGPALSLLQKVGIKQFRRNATLRQEVSSNVP